MKLENALAAGGLMESVNVLGHNAGHFPGFFPFRQLQVRPVGLCIQGQHLVPVKTEELFRLPHEKSMGKHLLRRIIVLLVVQSVHAAEIGDSALCGNTCTAEKDDLFRPIHQTLQCFVTHSLSTSFSGSGCAGACTG